MKRKPPPQTPEEWTERLLARGHWFRQLSPESPELLKQHAGAGISKSVLDQRMPLIEDNKSGEIDPELLSWIESLDALDLFNTEGEGKGDPDLLLSMLIASVPAPARAHVADLFSRYTVTFTRKPGRPRTPSYVRSRVEQRIIDAVAEVNNYIAHGVDKALVLKTISGYYGLKQTTLVNALAKRRGSARK